MPTCLQDPPVSKRPTIKATKRQLDIAIAAADPKNKGRSLRSIAKDLGASITAGNIYNKPQKAIINAYQPTPDDTKAAFLRGAQAAFAKGDLTNYLRAHEDVARTLGMFIDRTETKIDVSIEHRQAIDKLIDNVVIDAESSTEK